MFVIVGSERWERLPTDRVRLIAHRRTGPGLAATVQLLDEGRYSGSSTTSRSIS